MVNTVTITMREGYGLYPNKRGNSTIDAVNKTNQFARGGLYYPKTLEEPKGGTLQTYSTWCSGMAGADCNLVRVKFGHANTNELGGQFCIEPPPAGTYWVWEDVPDVSDLTAYRNNQITYPLTTAENAIWQASNFKTWLDQMEANNVYAQVILFAFDEFQSSGWYYHAWNSDNHYINGDSCEAQDQGFVSDPTLFYTNADCIQAAKDRIDFIVDIIGSSPVVVAWELFAEMSWCIIPGFWGESSINSAMINNIRNKINPWVTEIGNYLRAADPYNRPIGCGIIRPPSDYQWPSNPDVYANITNEPLVQYPMDYVAMNMYEPTWDECVLKMKAAKMYTDKMIWVTQYSPIQFDQPPAEEPAPYNDSKKRCWIQVCGERWGLSPLRWTGLSEISDNNWGTGGYADPDWYGIPGVIKNFCDSVSWNQWRTDHEVYDSYITSGGTQSLSTTGTPAMISYGDINNVTMLLNYSGGGTKTINVSNVSNGTYTFTYYDWTLGSTAGSSFPVASGSALSVDVPVTEFADNMIVAHLLKQ